MEGGVAKTVDVIKNTIIKFSCFFITTIGCISAWAQVPADTVNIKEVVISANKETQDKKAGSEALERQTDELEYLVIYEQSSLKNIVY